MSVLFELGHGARRSSDTDPFFGPDQYHKSSFATRPLARCDGLGKHIGSLDMAHQLVVVHKSLRKGKNNFFTLNVSLGDISS